MLTVTYPAGIGWQRAFVVDQNGYILSEVTISRGAVEEQNVVTAWLPPYLKRPRWDFHVQRWTESHGWQRQIWRQIQRGKKKLLQEYSRWHEKCRLLWEKWRAKT